MGIAFWYSKISWNKIIFKAKHVFIGFLNNLTSSLTMIQTYSHSCFPFPDFCPNNNFLQQWLNSLQANFLKTQINFGIIGGILNYLWHCMAKTQSYKWGRQLKGRTKNYRLQGIGQCVQIWAFIFNKSNDFVKQTKMNQVKFSPSSSWIH
jgi:hypothetical protein